MVQLYGLWGDSEDVEVLLKTCYRLWYSGGTLIRSVTFGDESGSVGLAGSAEQRQ